MMKIGYIINQEIPLNLPRGDAVHVVSFIENLNRIGCDVFLIKNLSFKKKALPKKYYTSSTIRKDILDKELNIKIHYIKSLIKFYKIHRIFYSIEFYYRTSSIIKKERPDILHEREVLWRTYLNFGGALLAHKYNIPYVLEVNAPILYERGRYHSYISCELEKIFEKKLFAKANKIIVVSNVLKSYLLSMGVQEEKIAVVPNGADGRMFNPNISGLKIRERYQLEDKKVICFSGSLDQQWQGIEYILKSAKIINSFDPSVRFLIIGNTEGQEAMVKSAPDNVIFTGQIEHIKVPTYLAVADILVAPYKREEDFKDIGFYNSPVKIFEYMAMGKPIITSNIGQIGEILEHGKTGLLIEPGNYKELARNILTLMDDEHFKKKLGKNARIEVEKNYTWERNARNIMAIYEDLV